MQVYSLRGEPDTVLTQFPILRPGLTVMNTILVKTHFCHLVYKVKKKQKLRKGFSCTERAKIF